MMPPKKSFPAFFRRHPGIHFVLSQFRTDKIGTGVRAVGCKAQCPQIAGFLRQHPNGKPHQGHEQKCGQGAPGILDSERLAENRNGPQNHPADCQPGVAGHRHHPPGKKCQQDQHRQNPFAPGGEPLQVSCPFPEPADQDNTARRFSQIPPSATGTATAAIMPMAVSTRVFML